MENKNQKLSIEKMLSNKELVSKLAQKNLKGGIGCPPPIGVHHKSS